MPSSIPVAERGGILLVGGEGRVGEGFKNRASPLVLLRLSRCQYPYSSHLASRDIQ